MKKDYISIYFKKPIILALLIILLIPFHSCSLLPKKELKLLTAYFLEEYIGLLKDFEPLNKKEFHPFDFNVIYLKGKKPTFPFMVTIPFVILEFNDELLKEQDPDLFLFEMLCPDKIAKEDQSDENGDSYNYFYRIDGNKLKIYYRKNSPYADPVVFFISKGLKAKNSLLNKDVLMLLSLAAERPESEKKDYIKFYDPEVPLLLIKRKGDQKKICYVYNPKEFLESPETLIKEKKEYTFFNGPQGTPIYYEIEPYPVVYKDKEGKEPLLTLPEVSTVELVEKMKHFSKVILYFEKNNQKTPKIGYIETQYIHLVPEPLNEKTGIFFYPIEEEGGICPAFNIFHPFFGSLPEFADSLDNVFPLTTEKIGFYEAEAASSIPSIYWGGWSFSMRAQIGQKDGEDFPESASDWRIHYPQIKWSEEEYLSYKRAINEYIAIVKKSFNKLIFPKEVDYFKPLLIKEFEQKVRSEELFREWGYLNKGEDLNWFVEKLMKLLDIKTSLEKAEIKMFLSYPKNLLLKNYPKILYYLPSELKSEAGRFEISVREIEGKFIKHYYIQAQDYTLVGIMADPRTRWPYGTDRISGKLIKKLEDKEYKEYSDFKGEKFQQWIFETYNKERILLLVKPYNSSDYEPTIIASDSKDKDLTIKDEGKWITLLSWSSFGSSNDLTKEEIKAKFGYDVDYVIRASMIGFLDYSE